MASISKLMTWDAIIFKEKIPPFNVLTVTRFRVEYVERVNYSAMLIDEMKYPFCTTILQPKIKYVFKLNFIRVSLVFHLQNDSF